MKGESRIWNSNAQSRKMDAHLAKVDQSSLGSKWGAGDIMYKDVDAWFMEWSRQVKIPQKTWWPCIWAIIHLDLNMVSLMQHGKNISAYFCKGQARLCVERPLFLGSQWSGRNGRLPDLKNIGTSGVRRVTCWVPQNAYYPRIEKWFEKHGGAAAIFRMQLAVLRMFGLVIRYPRAGRIKLNVFSSVACQVTICWHSLISKIFDPEALEALMMQ